MANICDANRPVWFVDYDYLDMNTHILHGDLSWDVNDSCFSSIDSCINEIHLYYDVLCENGDNYEDCIPIFSIIRGEWDDDFGEWICPTPYRREVDYRIAYCTREDGAYYGVEANEYGIDEIEI